MTLSSIGHQVGRLTFAVLLLLPSGFSPLRAAPAPWQSIPEGRYRPLTVSGHGAGFKRLDPATIGLAYTNRVSPTHYLTNQIVLNGSGVALGDVDGDGLCDAYFCGLETDNVLYRNLGDWRFEAVPGQPELACAGMDSAGALLVDVDGDADLDLVVNTVGRGTHLFLNDARGRFTRAPGGLLNSGKAGMSSAAADYDGDGDLDLYVTNYRTDTVRDMPNTRFEILERDGRRVVTRVNGRPTTEPDLVGRFLVNPSGGIVEFGEADVLYRNDGAGVFTPLSFTNGLFLDEDGQPLTEPPYDWGLSVLFRDLDGDGRPDIYVCNDFDSPDRLWINQGDGRFRAASRFALRHTSIFSMGLDAGDLNRDGIDDLFISDMLMQAHSSRQLRIGDVPPVPHPPGVIDDRPQYSFNTLQVGRGDGTYAEVAWYAGAEASGWTWCVALLDVDLDGYEDALFPTGHELDMMNADVIERGEVEKTQRQLTRMGYLQLRTMFQHFNTPNVAFRNLGNLRFQDVSEAWGFTDAAVSQGIAFADFDLDGDLDVVVNNLNSTAAVYENIGPAPRVAVRLRGQKPNPQGIGARVRLLDGAVPVQQQVFVSGGRYLSGDDVVRVFAAGDSTNRMRLEVQWPRGARTVIEDVRPNALYEIVEPDAATASAAPAATVPAPWFEPVRGFAPVHVDEPIDELARQPLLPFRLSGLGPGVAWTDLDRDGWDDLVLGAGRGGVPLAFRNRQGRLDPILDAPWDRAVARDLAGVVALDGLVVFASANYEDGLTNGGWLRIYDTRRQVAGESLPGPRASAGPLAFADVDRDGDLDLFLGGRARAGRYPEPAESLMLANQGGRFAPSTRWEKLGLVSAATFSDLDGDGWPDLVLACEWGPVRVYRNDGGQGFKEITADLGLKPFTGWWRSVTTGDFNGDGRPDIVAGNWGLNSRYQATPAYPARLHYGDLDGDQVLDVVESRVDPVTGRELPARGLRMVEMALYWVRETVGSFEAYGKASLPELYGERLNSATLLEATTLATTLFLNRGDSFEAHPLPPEAQWSPVFGISVADFNGDGREDLYLGQNFFGLPPDGVRQDAGRGLVLEGDGTGGFRVVPSLESGIRIYGEQRGTAVADYDVDGRTDLAVTQNANTAVLLHNLRARPGLRVRLAGPPGNSAAFGASIRLGTPDRFGPRREIRSGSGYLSQDSAAAVLHSLEPPTRLEVVWPDGQRTLSDVPSGAQELVVNPDSTIQVVR